MANTPITYFDRMYADPDPWGYESSFYEQRKYALTIASLGCRHYRRAFEPGCSIGVLTELLAERCGRLIAADFHRPTLERARTRLAGHDHVELVVLEIPDDWPGGDFDLIVLSEIAYYLDPATHAQLIDRVHASIQPAGEVILVHWCGPTDYPQSGDAVHDRWTGDERFITRVSHRDDAFRLDVLTPVAR